MSDLALTFSVTENDFGEQKEIDLVPGGQHLEVTSASRFRYVNLVADYHLNVRGSAQAEAFLSGLFSVVRPDWISSFTQPELQALVSGSPAPVDLVDLRKHTAYSNGYFGVDRNVARFWRVVGEFSDDDKARLLEFTTSCARPPLLGFAALQPHFTLQRAASNDEALPTASTCFNTLKLPPYSSSKVMKAKLLYAIRAGSGFELS